MMYPYKHMQSLTRQNGVVLIMSLVLLTVLTLIGITSMSGSSMQERIASNMQQHNIAFQGGQSSVAYSISAGSASPINFRINIPNPFNPATWPVQPCTATGCTAGVDWKATAQVVYKGCGKGFGNSLEAGKGISFRTFEVQVNAQTNQGYGNATSRQYEGVIAAVKQCY